LCKHAFVACVSELLSIVCPFEFLYVYLIPVLIFFIVQACAYCIMQLARLFGCCWNMLIYTENMSITPRLKSSSWLQKCPFINCLYIYKKNLFPNNKNWEIFCDKYVIFKIICLLKIITWNRVSYGIPQGISVVNWTTSVWE
jgi:hypothetical protein